MINLLSERIIRKGKVGKIKPLPEDTKAVVVKDLIHEYNGSGRNTVGDKVKVLAMIPGDSVVHMINQENKELSSGDTENYTTYLVTGINEPVNRVKPVNSNDIIFIKCYDKDGNEYIGEDIYSDEELKFYVTDD